MATVYLLRLTENLSVKMFVLLVLKNKFYIWKIVFYLSIYLFVCLFVYYIYLLFIYLLYLFVYLFIHSFISFFIYLSIYLFILARGIFQGWSFSWVFWPWQPRCLPMCISIYLGVPTTDSTKIAPKEGMATDSLIPRWESKVITACSYKRVDNQKCLIKLVWCWNWYIPGEYSCQFHGCWRHDDT